MKTGFHGPRSRENARLLIDAAKALGYPTSVVKTTRGGYNAPADVVEAALGVANIEEGVTYPAPDEPKDEAPKDSGETERLERPNNGASLKEWSDYAKSVGVDVTDEDTRNGLIEKTDALTKGTD